jgi:glycosyltransferase involved in cell wall biosynthesis
MSVPAVRVAAISAQSASAPSFRIRVMILENELRAHGVAIEPNVLLSDAESVRFYGAALPERVWVALHARRRIKARLQAVRPSTVLIQRQADLFPALGLERLASTGRRLVWDIDDAIWHQPFGLLKGARRRVRWLASHADHVIAANRVLAEHLSRYTEAITIVPSVVDTRSLTPREHSSCETLTLGWVGSFSTAAYLTRLQDILARFARSVADRRILLVVVGGDAPRIPGVEVESLPWSVEHERAALARMDIGLMPQPDTPWTRGKSAHKALQYMAAGIPVVADDVGITSETVGHERAGLIVGGPDEWVQALLALAGDARLRQRLGRCGRSRVERDFSVTRWAPVVASILRGD